MSKTDDYFPYTAIYEYKKMIAIRNDFASISPPSNWGEKALDFNGYYANEAIFLIFEQENQNDENNVSQGIITVQKNAHFFINSKESKIFLIPHTFNADSAFDINNK